MAFDTLAYAKKLKAAGFTEQQAEVQAETLAKLQRGGEQVVKVVHVHPGAQAIVGNVMSGGAGSGAGGGVSNENRNQPHATGQLPAGNTPVLPEVWSEDADRISVPVASREG